jgi:hypothetical protein
MSFLPRLSAQESEELFGLFVAGTYQVGISPRETRKLKIQLIERLQKIWDATNPKPFPVNWWRQDRDSRPGFPEGTNSTAVGPLHREGR